MKITKLQSFVSNVRKQNKTKFLDIVRKINNLSSVSKVRKQQKILDIMKNDK